MKTIGFRGTLFSDTPFSWCVGIMTSFYGDAIVSWAFYASSVDLGTDQAEYAILNWPNRKGIWSRKAPTIGTWEYAMFESIWKSWLLVVQTTPVLIIDQPELGANYQTWSEKETSSMQLMLQSS